MSTETPRPCVEGAVQKNGDILCSCGKLVGHATETSVQFHCRSCNVSVVVDFKVMILRNCQASIVAVTSGIATLDRIVLLMQQMQPDSILIPLDA